MRIQLKTSFLIASLFMGASLNAQNPIVQTKYTADPAPMVHNDTVFLYTTHDEDDADGFKMQDWLLYSSTDMVNWTDHGVVASLKDFKWLNKDNGAWAEQCIYRNGKFYMYCPVHGNGIGVLVSDSPYGPFTDPLGKPLVWQREHWYDIDPSPYIDDDGQAYLYWGNPNVYCVKLNEDMISYSGEIIKQEKAPEFYQEGPWLYKRNNLYYLAFASTCCPEGIGYATSNNPLGPWKFAGHIMPRTEKSRGNHPGIIDYKGKSYVFGLNYDLMHLDGTLDHHERRSVSVAELEYNQDGSIKEIPYWNENGVSPTNVFNPFQRVQAETMAWGRVIKTRQNTERGVYVTDIDNNDFIKLQNVDFGKKGAKQIEATLSSIASGIIEVRIDNKDGNVVAQIEIASTGNLDSWKTFTAKVSKVKGVHDLYFVFKSDTEDFMKFDYWQFK